MYQYGLKKTRMHSHLGPEFGPEMERVNCSIVYCIPLCIPLVRKEAKCLEFEWAPKGHFQITATWSIPKLLLRRVCSETCARVKWWQTYRTCVEKRVCIAATSFMHRPLYDETMYVYDPHRPLYFQVPLYYIFIVCSLSPFSNIFPYIIFNFPLPFEYPIQAPNPNPRGLAIPNKTLWQHTYNISNKTN